MTSTKIKLRRAKIQEMVVGVNCFHNCIKGSHFPAESDNHINMKCKIARYCYRNGWDFYTEVVFRDNTRADFLISDLGIIFELLSSETLKQVKKKKYPCNVIPVSVTAHEIDIFNMLDDLKAMEGKNWEYYKEGIK